MKRKLDQVKIRIPVAEDLEKTIRKARNYNEPDDLTQEKKREARQDHTDLAGMLKVTRRLRQVIKTAILKHLQDSRRQCCCQYDLREIVMIAILINLLGIKAVSTMKSELNYDEALENLRAFVLESDPDGVVTGDCNTDDYDDTDGNDEELSEEEKWIRRFPDYKTINNALSKVVDPDDMNCVFKAVYKELFRSKRFDTYKVQLVYEVPTEDGKGRQYIVKSCIPVLMDGGEIGRYSERQSVHDLTAVYNRNDPAKKERIDYFHKVFSMKALLGPLVITLYTKFIENPEALAIPENQGTETFKQNSEWAEALKAVKDIHQWNPNMPVLLQGDGLYMRQPIVELAQKYGWAYLFTFKSGCSPTMMDEYEREMDALEEQVDVPVISHGTPGIARFSMDIAAKAGREGSMITNILEFSHYEEKVVLKTDEASEEKATEKAAMDEEEVRKGGRKKLTYRQKKELARKAKETRVVELSEDDMKLRQRTLKRLAESHQDFDPEQVENMRFQQEVDPDGTTRTVAVVTLRFMWGTNIVLDLANNKEATAVWERSMGYTSKGIRDPQKMEKARELARDYLRYITDQGRDRWKIENEGFNFQKNNFLQVKHRKSHNYEAMKMWF